MMGFKRTLEDALEKMPDYEGTVWRGADLPKRVFDKIRIGEVFEDKGFVSTSLKKGLEFNGKHKFVITSKRGKRINGLSQKPGEREVLFRDGTKFRVLNIEEKGSKIWIYMEEID